ncbi:hypothetical protein WJX73_002248 [Symbiochloris irregularis]|uniref:Uncharacterized protein n=1 Tax=Symbiochloris irregularis TaxID=706552 RepID=A0AAW1P097_9CHLO
MGYGPPPWVFKGRAFYQLNLVKVDQAKQFVPDHLKLVSLFGYTLGGLYLARYTDSPAGAFDEVVVLAGLVWNFPTSCAWAARVYVNNREARDHGRSAIGLPSCRAALDAFVPPSGSQRQQPPSWWAPQSGASAIRQRPQSCTVQLQNLEQQRWWQRKPQAYSKETGVVFLSFLIVRVLCRDAVLNTPGTTQGFLSCVYVTQGGYADDARKLVFLAFWLVQQLWYMGFPAVLAYAMMPAWFRRSDKLWIWLLIVATATAVLVLAAGLNKALNTPLQFCYLVPLGLALLMVAASIIRRYSNDDVNFLRWSVLMIIAAMVAALYIIIFPKLITKRATAGQLLLLRLVFHPLIWKLMTLLFTHTARHIGTVPNLMQTALYMWPAMYSSIYGRFLLLQLSGVGDVLVLNIVLSLYDIVVGLSTRHSGYLLLRVMYGERTAEAMLATQLMNQIRMAELVGFMVCEHAGILCAAAVFSFGRITGQPGVPPNQKTIWLQALVQLVTAVVAHFVGLACDWRFLGIDLFSCWVKDMRRFVWCLLLIATIGGSRLCVELLLLFCPSSYPGIGVLLEYCDRPSIFQLIGRG